jgi:hypothetical protein
MSELEPPIGIEPAVLGDGVLQEPAPEPAALVLIAITYNAWIKDAVGITLANYWMYTYYCFDYNTVTYHDTWATGSVTTTGGIGGWQYDGYNGRWFNCYDARGTVGCSGNHEATQGIFKACQYNVCYSTWYPYVQEWETYKGTFSFSYSD